MTEQEEKLLHIIREGKDPAALMVVALEAITACLRKPGPSQSPTPVSLESDGETDQ